MFPLKTEFEKLSQAQQEELLMPELLLILRRLGGYATRHELKKEIKTSTDFISETFVDFVKNSKNGREYQPFNYIFNFSVSNLELARFLNFPKRGSVELTEKGRSFDINKLNIEDDVRMLAKPKWEERSLKRKYLSNEMSFEKCDKKDIIELEESQQFEDWRVQLNKALKRMSPKKFEIFSRRLVKAMGVDIDETIGVTYVGDGGLDGFGYITSDDFRTTRVAIQAKRWAGKVSSPEIDKFRGAMDKYNAEFGIFVTTSDFTREAIKASRIGTRVITLVGGDEIADLVAKFNLYVTPVTTYELDSFYLEND